MVSEKNGWVTWKMTGLDELQNKLDTMSRKDAWKTVKKALRAAANMMIREFIANAPTNKGIVFTRKHFSFKIQRPPNSPSSSAGEVLVGPNQKPIDYPNEWGGKTHKVNAAILTRWMEFGSHIFKRRRPFMTASTIIFPEIQDKITDVLKEELGLDTNVTRL